ncbi:MAG: hypothetical protein HFG66_01270 [Hungatella sp.]|nr:hypothetical protein [Hungatella sp.]
MTTVIGIGIGIFSIAGIIAIIFMRKRRKKMQEEKFQATKKVREDSLKQALANNLNPSEDSMAAIPYRPYKVDYSTGENQNNGEKLPLLQLIEKNKLSEKKYIFRANETVTIGIQFGSVDIISNPENGEGWCELFFQKDSYCIRSLGRYNVSVQRNKNTTVVDRYGIRLKSKDIIKIEDTTFQVFYIKG